MSLISAGRFITILAVNCFNLSFYFEFEAVVYSRNYFIYEEPWIVFDDYSPISFSSSKKPVGDA